MLHFWQLHPWLISLSAFKFVPSDLYVTESGPTVEQSSPAALIVLGSDVQRTRGYVRMVNIATHLDSLLPFFPPPRFSGFFFFFFPGVSVCLTAALPQIHNFFFYFLARGKLSEGETRSVSRHCSALMGCVGALPCCKVACVVCNNWLAHSQSKQVRGPGCLVHCARAASTRKKNDTMIKLHVHMQQWHLLPRLRRFTAETQMVPFRISNALTLKIDIALIQMN